MIPSQEQSIIVDVETHMDKPGGYSLEKMSTKQYVDDKRFDLLSASISEGSGNIDFYYKLDLGKNSLEQARKRVEAAAKANKTLIAHNLNFEGLIILYRLGINFNNMMDTTGYLRFLGIGASLKNGGRLVGIEKQNAPPFNERSLCSTSFLKKFTWYNMIDVVICRRIFFRALDDERFSNLEWYISCRIAQENIRGIKVNQKLAKDLANLYVKRRESLIVEFCEIFTDFNTAKINSHQVVKEYIKQRFGIALDSIDKGNPDVAVAKGENDCFNNFLRLRDSIRTLGTWSKNLSKIATGSDRIYCPLKYFGAHTGRHSATGKEAGKINIQNLPKGDSGPLPELAEYRRILVPDEEDSWVSCDLATIEPRVTALLAGQHNQIEQFLQNSDIYIWFGGLVFPKDKIIKGGENNHLRQLCKQAVIGLGYGMGLIRFYKNILMQMPKTDSEVISSVFYSYRRSFPNIMQLRKDFFEAFKKAADNGISTKVGRCLIRRIHDFEGTGTTVEVGLPTSRPLFYRSIVKHRELVDFGNKKEWVWAYRYADRMKFSPLDSKQTIRHVRRKIIPQTLIENIVQATSRDILMAQQREIETHDGLRVQFTVHDEAIVACRRCNCPSRDENPSKENSVDSLHKSDCPWISARQIVQKEMSKVPECFPELKDLPVACELSDSIRDCYGK